MPGLTLDSPPPMPAPVAAQMGSAGGGNPFAGMGDMVKGQAPGARDPQGDLKAAFDTVKKVLQEKIAGMGPGKNLVSRAMQLLDQALVMEAQKGPGTPPSPQPGSETTKPEGESHAPMSAFPG